MTSSIQFHCGIHGTQKVRSDKCKLLFRDHTAAHEIQGACPIDEGLVTRQLETSQFKVLAALLETDIELIYVIPEDPPISTNDVLDFMNVSAALTDHPQQIWDELARPALTPIEYIPASDGQES